MARKGRFFLETIKLTKTAGKIGPHEGMEIELALSEKKDLIYFPEDGLPEGFFEKAISAGLEKIRFNDGHVQFDSFIFFLPHNRDKASNLRDKIIYNLDNPEHWEKTDREIGRMLGYSEEDIDFFINNIKNRS